MLRAVNQHLQMCVKQHSGAELLDSTEDREGGANDVLILRVAPSQKADGAAKREATAKLSQTTLDLEKAKRQLASAETAAAEAMKSIDKEKLKADAESTKVGVGRVGDGVALGWGGRVQRLLLLLRP